MLIAVGKGCDGLIVYELEFGSRLISGVKALALAALPCLQIDPHDEMLLRHGVRVCSDLDSHFINVHSNNGNMFFLAGVKCIRLEECHFFTAARHWSARVIDQANDITAVPADIKTRFTIHKILLSAALPAKLDVFSCAALYQPYGKIILYFAMKCNNK